VIALYQFSSSHCVWESVSLCFKMSAKIPLVSVTGIFEYKPVISSDVKVKCGIIVVSRRLCIRSLEFSMLNVSGRGAS
jgi:hypothetical protein